MQRHGGDDEDEEKLVPEWSVGADEQIVIVGFVVVALMALVFGWQVWAGGDGDDVAAVVSTTASSGDRSAVLEGAGQGGEPTGAAAPAVSLPVGTTPETTAATAAEQEEASPTLDDVDAALRSTPGDVTATVDGAEVALEGYVANDTERRLVADAVAGVAGVERVDNRLIALEPEVVAALSGSGVVAPEVVGEGTVLTVRGTLQTEADRAPAIDAASEVPGVSSIIDELSVSVAADLNELPQVEFATASAEILPASFADLDEAAALIRDAGPLALRVEGWTDVQGDDGANLELSQRRAEAVVAYLVAAGVSAEQLTAVGNGETEQFASGVSPEALAANRVVRFVQTD